MGGSVKQELDSCPDLSAHAWTHARPPLTPTSLTSAMVTGASGEEREREKREEGADLALFLQLEHTHTHIHTACQVSILMLQYDRCCVRCIAAVSWARSLRLLDPLIHSFQEREKYSQHLSLSVSLHNDTYDCFETVKEGRGGGVTQDETWY